MKFARLTMLGLAMASGGCFWEVSVGAYHASQREGRTGVAFDATLALGTYLDSFRAPVAISYSGTYERARADTGDIVRYKNNDQQLRLDYAIGRPKRFQPGITAALRWGDDSYLTFDQPGSVPRQRSLSSQYTVFLGANYRALLIPGVAWNDSFTLALGPAVQRFDTVLGGEMSNIGGQLRLSMNASPMIVLATVTGKLKGMAGSWTSSSSGSGGGGGGGGGCPGGYFRDHCDVDGHCTSDWFCP